MKPENMGLGLKTCVVVNLLELLRLSRLIQNTLNSEFAKLRIR